MENGELVMKDSEEVDESGYSEKKIDKNIDLQAGQWLDLQQGNKKTPPQDIKKSSSKQQSPDKPQIRNQSDKHTLGNQQIPNQQVKKRDQKLIQAVDGVNAELQTKIDDYLRELVEDVDKADDILRRIVDLQGMQKSLLQALKWEAKGSLEVSKLPKQVQNLLK